ncbi:MAG: DsbA family protein, partial [Roseococcus sp.]
HHRSPGTGENTAGVITRLGRDAAAVLARAAAPENLARIEAETDAARAVGIFGSPSFVVGEELFWGDDRLEAALDWANRPRLPTKMPPM